MKTSSSPSPHRLAVALGLALGLAAPAWAQHEGHAAEPAKVDRSAADHSSMDHSSTDHSSMDHSSTDHSSMDHSKMDHSSEDHSKMDHSSMDHSSTDHSSMDHSKMDHAGMDHAQHAAPAADGKVDHAAMGHGHAHAAADTAPREPIPPVTPADLAAAFPAIDHHAMQHAPAVNHKVTFNRLEAWDGDHGTGQAWEGIAWIGTDTDRVWLRSEGEREGGHTESADLEVLYGRSVSPWWDVVAGVRHDFKPGDARSWAAFGVQGMAPYRFEVSATAYVGESGQVAANVEAEYTLRITNRLILQPLVEAEFSARDEPAHGTGSGLNTLEAGLRLRYEVTRRFAPYVGVVHERSFGDTADYRRAEGERSRDTRVVAGVRLWF